MYPSVTIMPPGAVVRVVGCEQGCNWCDVQMGMSRGWVDAAFLQAHSPSGPVVVVSSAVMLGVPVVPLGFNSCRRGSLAPTLPRPRLSWQTDQLLIMALRGDLPLVRRLLERATHP